MSDYRPIDCSIHDRMESASVLRQTVRVTWRDASGERVNEGLIADIVVRDGAEYLVLDTAPEIRLDYIDAFTVVSAPRT